MKSPFKLKEESIIEVYDYFDKHIRKLKRNAKGEIDQFADGLADNDVDAFRHAYTSGAFTIEFSELEARFYGYFQETQGNYGSNSTNAAESRNMDFWNNDVGIKYGKKTKSKQDLLKLIHKALNNGELIINIKDPRIYKGQTNYPTSKEKPVIVFEETKTGRNKSFVDLMSEEVMTREAFVEKIKAGKYLGYKVASIKGIATPMSKPDRETTNNLG